MSTSQPPARPPPLQRPPGYRDPTASTPRLRPPPKPATLPPSFQPNKRRRSRPCCRAFCCTLLVLSITLTLTLSAAGAIFYLWFQPRLPEIHINSIKPTKIHVTNSPDPTLDSKITTRLKIRNPNRSLKMVYGETRVTLTAVKGGAVLGDETVSGFTQNTKNVTSLEIVMEKHGEFLDDEMAMGLKSKNLVVSVEIWSGVGVKGNRWSVGSVHVKVVCEGMRIKLIDRSKCRIKILDWFYIDEI